MALCRLLSKSISVSLKTPLSEWCSGGVGITTAKRSTDHSPYEIRG